MRVGSWKHLVYQRGPLYYFAESMCALESEYAGSSNQRMPQGLSQTLLLLLSVQLDWGNTKSLLFSFLTFGILPQLTDFVTREPSHLESEVCGGFCVGIVGL